MLLWRVVGVDIYVFLVLVVAVVAVVAKLELDCLIVRILVNSDSHLF